jgi:hypothetical protein
VYGNQEDAVMGSTRAVVITVVVVVVIIGFKTKDLTDSVLSESRVSCCFLWLDEMQIQAKA